MTQKTLMTVVGILVLLVFVGIRKSGDAGNDPLASAVLERADIVLTEKGFVPDRVYIKLGGAITFKTLRDKPFWPASNLHPTHGIYSEFDPKRALSTKESWTFRFDKAGEWKYHDHLRSYFTGIIYVVE